MVSRNEARRMIINALENAVMATLYKALSIFPDGADEATYRDYDLYAEGRKTAEAIFKTDSHCLTEDLMAKLAKNGHIQRHVD